VLAGRQRVWLAANARTDVLLDCSGTDATTVRARIVGPPGAMPLQPRVQAAAPEVGWYREGALAADGSFAVACRPDGPTLVTLQGSTDLGAAFWYRLVDGPADLGTIDFSRNRVLFDAAGAELDHMPILRPVDGPPGISIVLLPELERPERFAVWGVPAGRYELVIDEQIRERLDVPESGTVTLR
jgi:hypothetical protein